jgi:hypothetical protein
MPNNNRNSRGFHNRDVINERAEAASNRDYQGAGMVKSSEFVGERHSFDNRMAGITSMKPLVSNGMTTAVRYSENSDPQLNVKINKSLGNYK